MLEKEFATKILSAGLEAGADFVELFVEKNRSSSVDFKNSKVEGARANTDYGIGIRLIYGTEVLFAHTSDDSEKSVLSLIKELAFNKASGNVIKKPSMFETLVFSDNHPMLKDPRIVGQLAKVDIAEKANIAARKVSSKVSQVNVNLFDSLSFVEIFNSDGLYAKDRRAWTRINVGVTSEDKGEIFSAREAPGAMGGFEVYESYDIEKLAVEAAEASLLMLDAGYIEGGKIPVVMGSGFGGVIFHEACGHLLETEAVRKKSSPFCDKMGEKIANSAVSAIDDGTVPNCWGSINIDDEGMPTEKTQLIKDGILTNFMSDKIGAEEVGVKRTGSGRRESYRYAPVARMRNTYIDAGNDSFEDMIKSAENGLYAKKMGGGSVNPSTGEFNFAVLEGYIIKNGKVDRPVRGAALIGKGHEILPQISMVGTDLKRAVGMCGAASGSVPVTVGQPSLKVDNILVGGR